MDLVASLNDFVRRFSYPAEQGLIVRQIAAHPVHPRTDRGNAAAYFSFDALRTMEAHVSEIPPGGVTATHRHTCEAVFFVLAGRGHTLLWDDPQAVRRIDWRAGDLFVTPINLWHRHANAAAAAPARYLEITNIPLMKSLGTWSIQPPQPQDDAAP